MNFLLFLVCVFYLYIGFIFTLGMSDLPVVRSRYIFLWPWYFVCLIIYGVRSTMWKW